MSKRKKKMSAFKKFMIIYTLILLVAGELALLYVNSSLKAYEKGDIDNYMKSLLKDIKKSSKTGNISTYFELADLKSEYEKTPSLEKGYKQLLSDSKLTYKKGSEENTYDLYAGDKLFSTVTLDGTDVEHRLGLLTYNVWKIKNINSYNKSGLYEVEAYIPNDYTLYINDIKVLDSDLISSGEIEEYAEIADKVELPKLNHYKISSLSYKPDIKIVDSNNKKIKPDIKDDVYYASNYFKTNSLEEAMKHLDNEFNPLEFAERWSLFLTADYDNEPGRGLNRLTPNLIEGTKMYDKAKAWATQVDITFTSVHTLDKETFTNEKVSNITVYNQNAFSAEIYLEKGMTIMADKPFHKTDVLHEMIYFVYYDGSYRVVNMQSVTGE